MRVKNLAVGDGKVVYVVDGTPEEIGKLEAGKDVRCGGLRWTVVAVHQAVGGGAVMPLGTTAGLSLKGDAPPLMPGMILRLVGEPMPDDEYASTMHQVMVLASFVRQLDLAGMLERIDRADSVGAVMDPTLYRRAHGKLDVIRQVIEGAAAFQRKLPTYSECVEADERAKAFSTIFGR